MSDNLVIEMLRAIRGDIGKLADRVDDIGRRMTTVETQLGSLLATEQSHYANTMLRIDGVATRLDRIERRLDLAEAPAP
jgi:hypothetical protein